MAGDPLRFTRDPAHLPDGPDGSPDEILSDRQVQLLEVLWEHGPCTIRDIHSHLGTAAPRSLHTIATLLTRLRRRGVVTCRRTRQNVLVYSAAVPREQVLASHVARILRTLFAGDVDALVTFTRALAASDRTADGDGGWQR